jgi:GT2 family glycosyltransferase
MKLSVIIPCYNAEDTIGDQLQALVEQQWSEPWEIIVVDNRCTDGSMSIVQHYQSRLPNLRIVKATERQGQPYALNTGAKAAKGGSLVFCDADDAVGEGYVAAMGEALMRHELVACGFDVERLNADWVRRSHGNLQQAGLSQYKYPPYLPHSGGGALGVRRTLHQEMGGFDETLPILHDTDFCWRLQLAGVKLHFVPHAVVHVRYRASLRGLYRQARSYAEYNVLLYKRYRSKGMPPISWKMRANAWARFAKRVRQVRNRGDMARVVWLYGWHVGRARGSLKHRVLAL